MSTTSPLPIGRRLAPPRFIAFVSLFVVGLIAAIPPLGWGRGTMTAFDVATVAFLALMAGLLASKPADMRHHARDNDANRAGLLALTLGVVAVILVAVASELRGKSDPLAVVLVVTTLALAWLFANSVYALHYAHLFYTGAGSGKDRGGIDIPDRDEPDYWDFVYFSFTLGMTFQTSDVDIKSAAIRRVTIGHCLAAFVFNIGVLAFSINVLGGKG